MAGAPPTRWRRRIRRVLVALLLSPFALLLLGNLLLATPWARERLARRLAARLGVETTVGRASCTPWGGLRVGDLRCLQPQPLRESLPEPLLEIREIEVHPRWDRLLRGEFAASSVRIERPRLVLSLEMMASMVSAGVTGPAVSLPPVAMTEVPVEGGSPLPPAVAPPAIRPPAGPAAATAWVEVVEGSGGLWFAGKRLLEWSGGEGKIPVAGGPAQTILRLGELKLSGRSLGRELSLPLSWQSPQLRCDGVELRLAEMQVKLSAALGLLPGLPFAAEVSVPAQAALGAGRVEARMQALGLLRHPSTWQALATGEARDLAIGRRAEPLRFEEGRGVLVLQGGVLQCPDLRLTGERASFLGNGHVRADGQGSAVLRVVLPPDAAAAWSRRLESGGPAPAFAPLETPDRLFLDLRWISYTGGQGVELGAGGPVVPLAEVAKWLTAR